MVAEITAPKSLAKVLAYNFGKVQRGVASVLFTEGIAVNPDGGCHMEEVLLQMQEMIPSDCRTRKPVFHVSLNPHPDDRLNEDTLCDIAQTYMQEMGYGNQPYIVFKHNDIAREHIHIVSLRVGSDGKKLPHDFEGRRSKKITNALEEKYQLVHSGKRQQRDTTKGSLLQRADVQKGNVKEQISSILKAVMDRYAFQSIGEMNILLARYNIVATEIKRTYRGRPYNGLVYAVTNTQGEKCTEPIEASKIGASVGYDAIQHHFIKSKISVRERSGSLRKTIREVMIANPTAQELTDTLWVSGIETTLRFNDAGRLYGITFLSEELGMVVNGSRLGKSFSAAVFNRYFNEGENPFLVSETKEKIPHFSDTTKQENEGELSDICQAELLPHVHGTDYAELAFARKMRLRFGKVHIGRKKK